MTDTKTATSKTVNTVLGPVPADDLGVVAVHEALLSVVPGAEYAYDITIDRAEIFEILAQKLTDFREARRRDDRRQHRHVPRPRRAAVRGALARDRRAHRRVDRAWARRRCSAATS